MKCLWTLAVVLVAVLGGLSLMLAGNHRNDDDVYNQVVIIKGTVEILNHPSLGRSPGSGIYLLFQRDDCRRCLIATTSDTEGKYQVRVGRGRYKVFVDNPSPPVYDMLAPDQPRFIDATSVVQDNQFDIKLILQPRI